MKELCYCIIILTKSKSKINKDIGTKLSLSRINGILINHIKFCSIEECKCKLIRINDGDTQSQIDNPEIMLMKNDSKPNQLIDSNNQPNSLNQRIFEIMNLTLQNFRNIKGGELEILQAHINYSILNKVYNSLYNIMKSEDYKLGLFQEFQIFCIRKSIEFTMIKDETKNITIAKENFGKIFAFHKKYMALHDLISETIDLYCEYWKEYLKPHPGIQCLILRI